MRVMLITLTRHLPIHLLLSSYFSSKQSNALDLIWRTVLRTEGLAHNLQSPLPRVWQYRNIYDKYQRKFRKKKYRYWKVKSVYGWNLRRESQLGCSVKKIQGERSVSCDNTRLASRSPHWENLNAAQLLKYGNRPRSSGMTVITIDQ